MASIYFILLIPFLTFCSENTQSIIIHKTEDLSVTLPTKGDEKIDFHDMLREIDSQLPDPESQQPPKTCRQRIFQNRTALIAAAGTISSGIIAGTVALIVHFTQEG
ncbi:MAG TPA: hypothetical protein VHA52_02350 [Candidatus Babeliaceae bacterium]|nr:hypothetical protein [Candidatus Babeliaceae bacterium]